MRLHDYLDFRARVQPDAPCIQLGARSLTYGQALAETHRLANALLAEGLKPGDRFAWLGKNSIEHALMYFAASKAGLVPVPLNYRLSPLEWDYIINDSGAKLLIATGDFAAAARTIHASLPGVRGYIALDAAGAEGYRDYRAWTASQPATAPGRPAHESQPAYQMYTSGTTGRPKGAIVSHRAVCANVEQFSHETDLGLGDRYLIVAPIYHAAAAISIFVTVAVGGEMVVQEDFSPPAVVAALSDGGVSGGTLVPAMIQACLVYVPDAAKRQYPKLRYIAYGASPISEQTLRQAIETFRCDFIQAYGMTETTAILTILPAADHRRALTDDPGLLLSAGRPMLGTEIRVVDESDNDVPVGEIGEIIARGPQLMDGYWNLDEATAEALRGGWMHTGDAGKMGANGYLYIQDRVKDMIVSGGENVYPRVVEDVLFQHPAIADAAVIGVPHEQWGETVKAVVVLRAGATAGEQEIVDFCRGRLGGFERPTSVDFIDALPRNASGKVLKRELREPYWRGHGRRVAGA